MTTRVFFFGHAESIRGSSPRGGRRPVGAQARMYAALRKFLHRYGNERMELEFRLGHVGPNGQFRAGVSKDAWQNVLRVMEQSPEWTLRPTNTLERVTATGSKLVTADSADGAHWIHKKRMFNQTDAHPASKDAPWTVRSSLSREETEEAPAYLALAPPAFKFERHKRRWSFRHRCWSLDLTQVRSNAPHDLDEDALIYEIELELVDTEELFTRPLENLLQWGRTILQDVCDMCKSTS